MLKLIIDIPYTVIPYTGRDRHITDTTIHTWVCLVGGMQLLNCSYVCTLEPLLSQKGEGPRACHMHKHVSLS